MSRTWQAQRAPPNAGRPGRRRDRRVPARSVAGWFVQTAASGSPGADKGSKSRAFGRIYRPAPGPGASGRGETRLLSTREQAVTARQTACILTQGRGRKCLHCLAGLSVLATSLAGPLCHRLAGSSTGAQVSCAGLRYQRLASPPLPSHRCPNTHKSDTDTPSHYPWPLDAGPSCPGYGPLLTI